MSKQLLHLQWSGTFWRNDSISRVNREMLRALARNDDIYVSGLAEDDPSDSVGTWLPWHQDLRNLLEVRPPTPPHVVVRFTFPPMFDLLPEGQRLVLMQPWEYGRIPRAWVGPILDGISEVWTPSEYSRNMFVDTGIPSHMVRTLPHGIDNSVFRPDGPRFPLERYNAEAKVTFLFVGGTLWRKGIDALLQAYLGTFNATDDVTLIVKDLGGKTFYRPSSALPLLEDLAQDPAVPRVRVISDDLPDHELAALMRSVTCLVHPYRGEGFALPVLEAMACGTPVIVTDGGPTADFVAPNCGWFIPATRRPQVPDWADVVNGWVLEPNTEALAEILRFVATNPEDVTKRAQAAHRHASHWTWDAAARKAMELTRSLVAVPTTKRGIARFVHQQPLVIAWPDYRDPVSVQATITLLAEGLAGTDAQALLRYEPGRDPDEAVVHEAVGSALAALPEIKPPDVLQIALADDGFVASQGLSDLTVGARAVVLTPGTPEELRVVAGTKAVDSPEQLQRVLQNTGPRPVRMTLRGDTADENIMRAVRWQNEYGLPAWMPPETRVLDVGAHVGSFTVAAWERGSRNVVSYEPEAENWTLLCENVAGLPGVTVHNEALWSRSGEFLSMQPSLDPANTGGGSVVPTLGSIPTISLRDAMASAGFEEIDFLKIDCEGAEIEILSAADESTLGRIRHIAGEYHDERRFAALARWLEPLFDVTWGPRGADIGMFRATLRRQLPRTSHFTP